MRLSLFHNQKRPLMMGIVNVTPDSFSGDGLCTGGDFVAAAVAQAVQMAQDGAALLDIGGESTRPGATPVAAMEEMNRIVPVIQALHARLPELPLSIDTMKVEVARAALAAGAVMINDISGVAQDPAMRRLAAETGAYLVLMHNQAQAATQTAGIGGEYQAPVYADVIEETKAELAALTKLALEAGVAPDKIILDPGVGFGKTPEQNAQIIGAIEAFAAAGFPVLLGASRKSFIGRFLDVPPEERLEGTAAVVAVATLRGVDILRVHDVKFMSRVARMTAALIGRT